MVKFNTRVITTAGAFHDVLYAQVYCGFAYTGKRAVAKRCFTRWMRGWRDGNLVEEKYFFTPEAEKGFEE